MDRVRVLTGVGAWVGVDTSMGPSFLFGGSFCLGELLVVMIGDERGLPPLGVSPATLDLDALEFSVASSDTLPAAFDFARPDFRACTLGLSNTFCFLA